MASYGTNTFVYGADGIRCQKNNTKYVLDGDRILKEYDGTKTILYYYGTNGVIGFRYNGADYYYRKNLFGDVLAIYDSDGTVVARYLYDAWGRNLPLIGDDTNEIKRINPIRYRSYYYDTETELYYLESRYYDPQTGRFINADSLDYLGDGEDLKNYNLFAYCENNPVMNTDSTGHSSFPNWAKWLIGGSVILGLGIATAFTGGMAGVILGAAFIGSVAGAATGIALGCVSGYSTGEFQGIVDGASTGFSCGSIIGGVLGALISGVNFGLGVLTHGKLGATFYGSAQKTGTFFHRMASNIEGGKMALQLGRYSQITLDRSLNKAGLVGRKMPDVIGTARWGKHRLIEVTSKSQTHAQMSAKLEAIKNENPFSTKHVVDWAANISRFFN